MKAPLPRLALPAAALALLAIAAPVRAAAPATTSAAAPAVTCLPAQLTALQNLQTQLDGLAKQAAAGKAQYWYVDPATCKVIAAVLRGATDPDTQQFVNVATATGQATINLVDTPGSQAVATEHAAGAARHHITAQRTATTTIYGGVAIYSAPDSAGSYERCTSGIASYDSSVATNDATTAGHCGTAHDTWYTGGPGTANGGTLLGTVKAGNAVFPGSDWAKITLANGLFAAAQIQLSNGQIQNLQNFAAGTIGEAVCHQGSTTGTQCGKVIALNVTTNFGGQTVKGLIETDAYAYFGDSGGPLYDGTTGLGLASSIQNDSTGNHSFYQPFNF